MKMKTKLIGLAVVVAAIIAFAGVIYSGTFMKTEQFNELDYKYIQMSAKLAEENVANGGGPFGAVIVKDGKVVATGVNRVTSDNDPTAHAEVKAIRAACQQIGTFKLDGCVIYSSCEPCPMCLSALYWAGVSKIIYGNTKEDADAIGFGDNFIYQEIEKAPLARKIPCMRILDKTTIKAFEMWRDKADKIEY